MFHKQCDSDSVTEDFDSQTCKDSEFYEQDTTVSVYDSCLSIDQDLCEILQQQEIIDYLSKYGDCNDYDKQIEQLYEQESEEYETYDQDYYIEYYDENHINNYDKHKKVPNSDEFTIPLKTHKSYFPSYFYPNNPLKTHKYFDVKPDRKNQLALNASKPKIPVPEGERKLAFPKIEQKFSSVEEWKKGAQYNSCGL